MTVVDSAAIVAGGSGATGWSARSLLSIPDIPIQQLAHNNFTAVASVTGNTARGQSFTPGASFSLAGVRLIGGNVGAFTDTYYLTIETNNAGKPSGTVLGTSDTVAGANFLSSRYSEFRFSTPVSLTASTKYWWCLRRSGAVNGTQYIDLYYSSADVYSSHGLSTFNGTSWDAAEDTQDFAFQLVSENESLYQVTQDASLHVWKSTDDGASWAELDNANAPAVNSSTKPFSADYHGSAGVTNSGEGGGLFVGYFSNTNTCRVRRFDIGAALWKTDVHSADATTDADFQRNIRVAATYDEVALFYTSLADDADLEYVRRAGNAAWGAQVQTLAVTSAEASAYIDVVKDSTQNSGTSRFLSMFWYHVTAGDVEVRTLTGTTLGTVLDVDITAADVEAEHASAVYQVYDPGTDTVLAAFIDADGTLEERTAQLEVTSASITLGTQHQVSAATSYLGRHLATCKFGSDLYIFASASATAIDYFVDVGATGTWSSVVNWKTGLTAAALSTAVPIPGVGILVSYTDNGNVVVDLYTVSIPASLTVTAATAAAAGEAVTLDAASKLTVTEATAPAAGQAVVLAGQGRLAVTEATAPAAGEAVTLDAAALFTVAAATAPAAGQNVTFTGQARLPVTEAAAPAAGGNVNLTAASVFAITVATAPAQGEAVNLAAAAAATMPVTPAEASAAGQNVALTGQGRLPVAVADAPAAGEAVTFDAAARFTVTEATAPAQGENVALTAGAAAALTVTPATASAQGEAVTLDAAASMVIDTATASAAGEDVTLDVAATMDVGTATAPAQGQSVTLTGQGRLAVTEAFAPAEGENVILFGGAAIPATLTVAPATALAAGETIALTAGARITVSSAAASATGEGVTLDAAAFITISHASATAAGETVGLIGQAILAVTPADTLTTADVALSGAANMTITAASADADAASILFGGSIGDLTFTVTVAPVVAFRTRFDPVLDFRPDAEPVLTFRTKGDY